MTESIVGDIIDAPLCEICHRSLPKGKRKYCSDECYEEAQRRQKAEWARKERAKGEVDYSIDQSTTPGMFTISVEDFADLLRRNLRKERQETEEKIYNETIRVIDSRFDQFRSDIRSEVTKQLERIQQTPALQTPVKEPSIEQEPAEAHLLKDTNKQQSQRIHTALKELQVLTKKPSYPSFNDKFKIAKHYLLKTKDGERAEKWLNEQIIENKKNTHYSLDDWNQHNHNPGRAF